MAHSVVREPSGPGHQLCGQFRSERPRSASRHRHGCPRLSLPLQRFIQTITRLCSRLEIYTIKSRRSRTLSTPSWRMFELERIILRWKHEDNRFFLHPHSEIVLRLRSSLSQVPEINYPLRSKDVQTKKETIGGVT